MKIPDNDRGLDEFASDLVDKCFSSRRERLDSYAGFQHYYLFGAEEGSQAPYNKIYPHIDLLTSFLYSQGTVEYDVAVRHQPADVYEQASMMSNRLNDYFHDYGIADIYNDALTWSLVYNSMLIKFNTRMAKEGDRTVFDRIEPYLVHPANFGVVNERCNNLDRQEAFCESYTINVHELKRRVSMLPNGADIMRRVEAQPIQTESTFPEAVNRIIIAGTSAMTTGTTRGNINVPGVLERMVYKPRTVEDEVEMFELYVWDDDKEDYRTITVAAPGVVIYGRKDIGNITGIKGEHPYTHICPNKLPDYFWGWPEIAGLIKIQDWASQRIREIRRILTLQGDPPKALSGWGGITDEKVAGLSEPGSWISDPTQGAKVDMLAPKVPEGWMEEFGLIQSIFNDVSGLSDILQGKGEHGVRAKSHADTLAKLGSARIKKRALSVERSLEEIGDLMVRIIKAKDARKFHSDKITPFIPAQFTDNFQVHVDAHSASPVFVEDHIQLAFSLAKAGAIGPDSLIELTKPPIQDKLLQRLKERDAKREAIQKQQAAMGIPPQGQKPKRVA